MMAYSPQNVDRPFDIFSFLPRVLIMCWSEWGVFLQGEEDADHCLR